MSDCALSSMPKVCDNVPSVFLTCEPSLVIVSYITLGLPWLTALKIWPKLIEFNLFVNWRYPLLSTVYVALDNSNCVGVGVGMVTGLPFFVSILHVNWVDDITFCIPLTK